MAVSFPQNPEVGDRYETGNFVYEWDGEKWMTVSGLTGGARQGPIGPTGATGATGPVGNPSTVAGPPGPDGNPSTVDGPPGPTGNPSTVVGPPGPTGNPSTVAGPPGPTGNPSTVVGPTGSSFSATDFVASGTISSGDTVAINSDGTVSVISTESFGPEANANSTSYLRDNLSVTYDSSNSKVIISYIDRNSSDDGMVVVGNVSGNTISFGTPVLYQSGVVTYNSVTYDSSNNKVVIAYSDSSNIGKAVVGTVSGTSISLGTPVTYSSKSQYNRIGYDSTNNKVVIAFYDTNSGVFRPAAIVGNVSGTSISFGSSVVFNPSNGGYHFAVVHDPTNNRTVIGYQENTGASSGVAKAVVGTVSGTSISFGTPVTITTNLSQPTMRTEGVFDSTNNKVIFAFMPGTYNGGRVVVGTVSGTSISFGSVVGFEESTGRPNGFLGLTYDPNNQKVIINYNLNSYEKVITGTVSGTSITLGTPIQYKYGSSSNTGATYDSTNQKTVLVYGMNNVTTARTLGPNLTDENYIGIAAEAISDTATGEITTVNRVNSGQSGLTAGQTYYVQNDGSLSTSPDSPSVVAGTAISSTEIIVK